MKTENWNGHDRELLQRRCQTVNKEKIIPEIVGILVNHDLSALQVTEILEDVKKTFLERSWHVASKKQHASKN